MKLKWTTATLCLTILLHADAAERVHGLPELPQTRISLSILSAMPATNLLAFAIHRSGLRLDLADEIKTNAVAIRFKFDNADATEVVGWALHFLKAHASVEGSTLHVVAGSPPTLPGGKPVAASQLLAAPCTRTNSWTHRLDQTVEYLLHIAGHKNFVMGPESPQFQTEVHLDPQGRSTADILEDLCRQAAMECSLHSNVVFIRRKETQELPNPHQKVCRCEGEPLR
jgi:hypothetical protein